MLMNSDNADQLKLEIWREIMRSKGEQHGYPSGLGGGPGVSYQPPPDPVATATKALNAFNALYPEPTAKPAKKKRARR